MDFGSLMTYTYNENPAMKHGASGLLTAVLFLVFLGGFFSGILGWKWSFIVIAIWSFWYHRRFLGLMIKVKTYDEILRDAISFGVMLFFVFVFWMGYFAGPKNWWWLCFPLVFVYIGLSRVIQKPYTGGH
ncbi:MAG: hypothetical protein NTU97_04800 [Candidatus Magasanikbacteria bacterium]|nr:hypothetical protein [Candidatus Magasanikbacteria bacterium]